MSSLNCNALVYEHVDFVLANVDSLLTETGPLAADSAIIRQPCLLQVSMIRALGARDEVSKGRSAQGVGGRKAQDREQDKKLASHERESGCFGGLAWYSLKCAFSIVGACTAVPVSCAWAQDEEVKALAFQAAFGTE